MSTSSCALASPWVSPITKAPLEPMPIDDADDAVHGSLQPVPRIGEDTSPQTGRTPTVLVDKEHAQAFPVMDDIPLLLAPERLDVSPSAVDLTHPHYAEAYAEMDFYNAGPVANSNLLSILRGIEAHHPSRFADDPWVWVDAPFDGQSQWDCYLAMGDIAGSTTLQIGGSGLHAVKFLLGGAGMSFLLTPMIGEAKRALWLAEQTGVADRFGAAVAIAEEMPLPDASVTASYSGGCVHHMYMPSAMPEILRVLIDGGRFVATEPWHAPLYTAGTRLFGKREANAHCQPLTPERISDFVSQFPEHDIIHHGTLTRYPTIALSKLGIQPSAETLGRIFAFDDRVSSRLGIRAFGSSVALLGTRGHRA